MSKQQLAAILEMSAQNPIPANATPAVMRAWVEDVASHLPVAENVQIERVNCGACDGDLILPADGDASRLIIFNHGGGYFFGSSRTHRVIASNLARAEKAPRIRGRPMIRSFPLNFWISLRAPTLEMGIASRPR